MDRTFFDLGGNWCERMPADLDDLRAALPDALPDAALEVRVGPLTLTVTRDADELVAQWELGDGWAWPVEVGEA